MNRKRIQYIVEQQRGMTYVEVLVSLFVVSMALVLFHASYNFLLLNRSARDQELAVRIAEIRMEELRQTPYNSLPVSGGFGHPFLNDLPNGSAAIAVSDYNSVTKEVKVVVSWKEPNSTTTHAVTLVTLMTENGL